MFIQNPGAGRSEFVWETLDVYGEPWKLIGFWCEAEQLFHVWFPGQAIP